MDEDSYPRIRVSGDARERGRQYGEAARDRVERTVALYADVFSRDAGIDWSAARDLATQFIPALRGLSGSYVEELEGVAEGAGVGFADVLAVNVRSEVKISAMARQARGQSPSPGRADGCTTIAVTPAASRSLHTLLAQNWDWYEDCLATVVVLEAEQKDGPNYVTVVEAGLLAKVGLNAYGVGVVTNLLASDLDAGAPGIPYHGSLRSLLDASQAVDALARLQTGVRASSANFIVASDGGLAFGAEGTPGDYAELHLEFPGDDGTLAHTNHFTSPHFSHKDVGRWAVPDSPFRLERVKRLLHGYANRLDVEALQAVLTDHFGHPSVSICSHPVADAPRLDRYVSVVSVVMDLEARHMWVTSGPPCQSAFDFIDYSDFLCGREGPS